MPPSIYAPNYKVFGGGPAGSILHPLVLIALVIVALLTIFLPRKYVIVPFLLGVLLIPYGQNLYLAGVHFFAFRILLLFGWVRAIWSKLSTSTNIIPGGFGTLDKLFILWATYRCLAGILQFMEMGAIPYQVSLLLDSVGAYFLFRYLIQDEEDVLRAVKAFAVVAVIASVAMLYEQVTSQNMFAFLGGIRPFPEIRNGKIRSQAMFAHALLAGSYGATLFPFFFFWLWRRGKARLLGILASAAAVVMTLTCTTSTSIMTLLGGILVMCFWPFRKSMRLFRWGIVIVLVGLELVMKAPVWFILARIDLTGGSSGWERAQLIDLFIKHFGEWWFIGTHNNANWGWDMWDAANQFISEGEAGGLVCFICFIAMFSLCFRKIGNARKAVEENNKQGWFIWMFGAVLFAQILAYLGIDYFDQTKFVWYALLVMISVVTLAPSAMAAPVPQEPLQSVPPWGVQRPEPSIAITKTWTKVPTRSR